MQDTDSPFRHSLASAWIFWFTLCGSLVVYLLLALQLGDRIKVGSEPSVPLRTLFYCLAIATFPLMNSLRRAMLGRGRHTRIGRDEKWIARRYLQSVALSLLLAEISGLLGLILFILGDTLQSFYIFLFMSGLGMVLYGPKQEEFRQFRLNRRQD